MRQKSFFDMSRRLESISAKGDLLELLSANIPFESFRAEIEEVTRLSPRTERATPAASPMIRRPPVRSCREGRDAALDLGRVAAADRRQLHPERSGRSLDRSKSTGPGRYRRIPNDCHSSHAGRDLLEQPQPFSADAELVIGKAGRIRPRPRQALNPATADGIDRRHEHDRYRAAGPLQRPHNRARRRQDDIRLATNSAAYFRKRSVSPSPQR
jgi:hypothetical protein